MAVITINIPDEQLAAFEEAYTVPNGYQAEIPNPAYDANLEGSEPMIPNPQTATEFIQGYISSLVNNTVVAYQQNKAIQAISIAAPGITVS